MVSARPAGRFLSRAVLGACLAACGASLPACVNNPVHDDQVEALGPEDPTVPVGPLHRPGQPCLVCHGVFGPASLQLAFGGTLYQVAGGSSDPAAGATVRVEDAKGATTVATANAAGNFYAPLSSFHPTFPLQTSVTSADGTETQTMQGFVARDGSCASCHTSDPGPTSAGPVVLSPGAADAATKG